MELAILMWCKNSCFADNYRLLSYRYQLELADWNNNITSLLGKVKMKSEKLYPLNPDVHVLKELCYMRDNMYYDIISLDEINRLIDDICLH